MPKVLIMTKIILPLFIVLSSFSYSQATANEIKTENTTQKKWIEYVLLSDVVKSDKGWYSIKDKTVKMKNGKKQDVDVNFSVGFQDYEPTEKDINIINIDMETVLMMTRLKLKNQFSFEPYNVSVFRSNAGFKIFIKYTAKNDLGIEKDGIDSFMFDVKGALIPQKSRM